MNSLRIRAFALLVALAVASSVEAALVLTSGLGTTHLNNIVKNGSYELGAPPDGSGNNRYWATGTTATPFAVPPGWVTSGPAANLGRWGNDAGSPYRLAFSDLLPDGRAGIFFNNGVATVDMPPTMNPNGSISFPGTPTFSSTNGAPAIISQTVPTNIYSQPAFNMSFWVSGEENSTNQGNIGLSIMAFRMTNVLPGDPIQYLTVPNGLIFGLSHLYEYQFSPINPLLPVTISFATHGHMDLTAWGGTPFGTEAIIDDVIINAVPEPSALVLLAAGGTVLLWTARHSRRNPARRR